MVDFQKLGNLLKMIWMQLKDLIGFMIILIILVFSFATIFFILYRRLVENY